ncbi:hypothetical protein JCM3765_002451 [Sporobolomyces pararoseus]
MPMFNTSNPFRSSNSSSSSSSTQSSSRRGPPRKTPGPSPSPASSTRQPARPPPDPRLVSLSQLDSATKRLSDLRKGFVLPRRLNFQPNSKPEAPKLDYSPENAPFHAYDEALTKLLIELDGIDSCGGEMEIRTRRKALVVEVEKELEKLDETRKREYQRQVSGGGSEQPGEQGKGGKTNENEAVVEERSRLSASASGPSLPPGIPLPPRDYPQSSAPPSNPWQTTSQTNPTQTQTAQAPSIGRRPSDHSQPRLARPPPAHRTTGSRHPYSNSPWNAPEKPYPKSRY